jgi:hypothetical protein
LLVLVVDELAQHQVDGRVLADLAHQTHRRAPQRHRAVAPQRRLDRRQQVEHCRSRPVAEDLDHRSAGVARCRVRREQFAQRFDHVRAVEPPQHLRHLAPSLQRRGRHGIDDLLGAVLAGVFGQEGEAGLADLRVVGCQQEAQLAWRGFGVCGGRRQHLVELVEVDGGGVLELGDQLFESRVASEQGHVHFLRPGLSISRSPRSDVSSPRSPLMSSIARRSADLSEQYENATSSVTTRSL